MKAGWGGGCPAGVRRKLTVHGLVGNEELLSRIAEHDIGYAGELAEPPSRNLTITNKLFQYLQAGLAVVASDTKGQEEAAALAGKAVQVFPCGGAEALQHALAELILSSEKLDKARQAAWSTGPNLCWEKEVQKYLDLRPSSSELLKAEKPPRLLFTPELEANSPDKA